MAGFTLIEAIVAFAIAGLALAAFVKLASGGLAGTGAAAAYVEATRRAQSRLDTIGVIAPLSVGRSGGEDGDGFSWSATVSLVGAQRPPAGAGRTTGMALLEVAVTESWGASFGQRSVTLTTLRIAPASPRE
jgi:general secretion pathway protein I